MGRRPFIAEETVSSGNLKLGRVCHVHISERRSCDKNTRYGGGKVRGHEMILEK